MGKFNVTQGKGMHFEFENGYCISTQIGFGNYCDNYNNFDLQERMTKVTAYGLEVESTTCEMAIFSPRGGWITGEIIDKMGIEIDHDDSVTYRTSFEDWFKIMKYVEQIKD